MRPQGRGVEQGGAGGVYIMFFLELAQPEASKLLTTYEAVKISEFRFPAVAPVSSIPLPSLPSPLPRSLLHPLIYPP